MVLTRRIRLSDNRSDFDRAIRRLLLSAMVLWMTSSGRVEANSQAKDTAGLEKTAASSRKGGPAYDMQSGKFPVYHDPNYVPWWESRDQYPSIDLDEADEHRRQIEGKRVWGRALPFFAQGVIDMGFDLPNPYGLSAIYVRIWQDLIVENLRVAVGVDAPPAGPVQPLPAVTFSDAWARNEAVQFKADTWVFPFMNVFLVGGYLDGKSELDVNLDLDALFPGGGGGLGTVTGRARPSYQGTNLGIGTNLAAGWENYFTVLSFAYAYSDLDIVDSRIEGFNFSPRIGFTHDLGRWGAAAVYTGATYLYADVELEGQAIIPVPPLLVPAIGGRQLVVDYAIDERNKDRWNYLVGGNWDISKSLSLQAEVGFGESRDNVITSMTYRF